MNAKLAICIAMPWAASGTVPTQPIITEAAENKPLSASPVTPIGQPKRNTRPNAAVSARQNRLNSLNRRKSG